MRREQDRIHIVSEICSAAALYRQHLVGRCFMYVFDDRYIEVIYKADSFRHLTGVDTPLSAKQFYKLACQRRLGVSQIGFTAQHPYDLCVRKLVHLSDLAKLATSESFMLEEITTQTQSYKFGTTDLNFSICMNKRNSECYVAESLRDEDCFSKSGNVYAVTHIFSKRNDAKEYTDIAWFDERFVHAELPDEIKSLLADSLLSELTTR